MIVDAGKKKVGDLLIGNFTFIAVGDGGDDTSTSQSVLDNEVSRKPATVNRVGNTLIYDVTFTGADLISNIVNEIGIFNASSGGEMLSRVNFNTIGPLSTSESVSFTFRLEVE
jgi:hypothetical protein